MIGTLAAKRPMIPPTRLSCAVGKKMKRQKKGKKKLCAQYRPQEIRQEYLWYPESALGMCIEVFPLLYFGLESRSPAHPDYIEGRFCNG
jgi:hypothetical protein